MASEETPAVGTFSFISMVVTKAIFIELPLVPAEEAENQSAPVQTTTNITFQIGYTDDSKRCRVILAVKVIPDPKKRPYDIQVDIEGIFEVKSGPFEQFEAFCQNGAPSVLFPYVRELIHRMTADGRYGAVRINPMNLSNLSKTLVEIDSAKK